MPLKSDLLSPSDRLQSCLIDDRSHVTPGSTGDYVNLIQLCLGLVDNLFIEQIEWDSMKYGPSTAAAVLSYKQKRKIINKIYQAKEDNIVGKMTIQSMDDDLVKFEASPSPQPGRSLHVCGRCGKNKGPRLLSAPPIARAKLEMAAAAIRRLAR